ncbi:hypothetical protein, partial [Rhodococcus sp. BP-316]|uniref:hypothetical protein n=1 Tax=Rhodococcus sp. BP-316 TaxID=2739445 RepID=UPI001C9A49C4
MNLDAVSGPAVPKPIRANSGQPRAVQPARVSERCSDPPRPLAAQLPALRAGHGLARTAARCASAAPTDAPIRATVSTPAHHNRRTRPERARTSEHHHPLTAQHRAQATSSAYCRAVRAGRGLRTVLGGERMV